MVQVGVMRGCIFHTGTLHHLDESHFASGESVRETYRSLNRNWDLQFLPNLATPVSKRLDISLPRILLISGLRYALA